MVKTTFRNYQMKLYPKMNKMKTILSISFLLLNVSLVFSQKQSISLSDAIEKSLENNYGIVIAKTESNIATLNNNWGTAGRYPNINFTASNSNSYDLINQSGNIRLNAGIGLSWTIFNGFKAVITKEKLEQNENLAKGRAEVVIETTIQDVILSYYNILLQAEKLNVLKKVMSLSEDRLKYEEVRHNIGGSLSYQVLQAKNLYLNDKSNYLSQEVAYKNAIRNFNFILGTDPEENWTFTETFKAKQNMYEFGDLLKKMLSNNQTLKNQYVYALLQKKETDLQKSALYPSLNLNGGIETTYLNNSIAGSSNGLSPYATLSLNFNLFSGGVKKRAIEIAKINEEIVQVEINEIKHSLTNKLYNEFDIYNLRKNLYEVSTESLEAAEISLKIAEEKYKSGAINSFNYRDIQLNYLNTAFQQLQSVYNIIYSQTSLTRITGGFLTEDK